MPRKVAARDDAVLGLLRALAEDRGLLLGDEPRADLEDGAVRLRGLAQARGGLQAGTVSALFACLEVMGLTMTRSEGKRSCRMAIGVKSKENIVRTASFRGFGLLCCDERALMS